MILAVGLVNLLELIGDFLFKLAGGNDRLRGQLPEDHSLEVVPD